MPHTDPLKFLALLITWILLAIGSPAAAQPHPNVVLIIGDDHGWPDSGFMESPRVLATNQGLLPIQEIVQTPNLDELAATGVLFRNGHSTASLCQPALRSLLSAGGLQSTQWQALEASLEALPGVGTIPRRAESQYYRTLPRELRRLGYASWEGGKMWEGTYEMAGFTHGLATSIGALFQSIGDNFGRTSWSTATCGSTGNPAIPCPALNPLRAFLDEIAGEPFFLWFAPMLPHTPYTAPAEYRAPFEALGLPVNQVNYLSNLTWLDELVGELLVELETRGLRENTLIIYLADNGWDMLTQISSGQGKGKGTLYELGFRTPLIFNWPGRVPEGVVYDDLVSIADVAPTILDFAGADQVPERQGRSLRPRIEGVPCAGRTELVGQQAGRGWFVRTPEWRYLRFSSDGREELYRIDLDPFEVTDLAAQHPELLAAFRAKVDEWTAALHQPPSRIEISGRLVDSETGEPLAGSSVRIAGSRLNALSGPDGFFRLGPLTHGDYVLTGESFLRLTNLLGVADAAMVPASLSSRGVHLPILATRPHAPEGVFIGRIEGQLRSDAGEPLADRIVQIRGRAEGRTFFVRTLTQPNGRYRAENLPLGTHRVTVNNSLEYRAVRTTTLHVENATPLSVDLIAERR